MLKGGVAGFVAGVAMTAAEKLLLPPLVEYLRPTWAPWDNAFKAPESLYANEFNRLWENFILDGVKPDVAASMATKNLTDPTRGRWSETRINGPRQLLPAAADWTSIPDGDRLAHAAVAKAFIDTAKPLGYTLADGTALPEKLDPAKIMIFPTKNTIDPPPGKSQPSGDNWYVYYDYAPVKRADGRIVTTVNPSRLIKHFGTDALAAEAQQQ
jgi:hypothetical protein